MSASSAAPAPTSEEFHVAIVDSGVANLAAVESALVALGVAYTITGDPKVALEASHVVLPGVGRFSAGLETLRRDGLDAAVREVHERGTPLLAVCLGMQMLGEGSDESPDTPGLGIVSGRFQRLPDSVRVPHLGWNQVSAGQNSSLPSGTAAFANSYYLPNPPSGWSAGWTTHGATFVSMLARKRTLACQFHPELSGAFGMKLIRDWLSGKLQGHPPAAGADHQLAWQEVAPRIVPCLDVKDGRVVKGIRFQNLRDAGDPADQAGEYERQGADEIVILDVGASHEARETQGETVRAVRRRIHIPLTVGGGVRTVDDAPGPPGCRRRQSEHQHGGRPGSEPFGAAEPSVRHTVCGAGHRRSPPGRQLGYVSCRRARGDGDRRHRVGRRGHTPRCGRDPSHQLGPGRDARGLRRGVARNHA